MKTRHRYWPDDQRERGLISTELFKTNPRDSSENRFTLIKESTRRLRLFGVRGKVSHNSCDKLITVYDSIYQTKNCFHLSVNQKINAQKCTVSSAIFYLKKVKLQGYKFDRILCF